MAIINRQTVAVKDALVANTPNRILDVLASGFTCTYGIVTIRIVNAATSANTISVHITSGGVPNDTDAVIFNKTMTEQGEVVIMSQVIVAHGESIYIRSDIGDATARVSGVLYEATNVNLTVNKGTVGLTTLAHSSLENIVETLALNVVNISGNLDDTLNVAIHPTTDGPPATTTGDYIEYRKPILSNETEIILEGAIGQNNKITLESTNTAVLVFRATVLAFS